MAFAGMRLTAALLGVTVSDTQNAIGTFSTVDPNWTETFLTGGPACAVAFVAPTSGEVLVSNNAFLDNATTARTYCSWIIRNGGVIGSGTTFLAGGDAEAITNITTNDSRFGAEHRVTGLTPGATYHIRQRFKVSTASTGSAQWKHLIVKPVV